MSHRASDLITVTVVNETPSGLGHNRYNIGGRSLITCLQKTHPDIVDGLSLQGDPSLVINESYHIGVNYYACTATLEMYTGVK